MAGTTISTRINATVTLGYNGYGSPLTIETTGTIDPGLSGAIGLYVPSSSGGATIVNYGGIFGAAAGDAGVGGLAVALAAAATLTNAGLIEGGSGGDNFQIRQGGDGLYGGPAAIITNSGQILGGSGGAGTNADSDGGAGVYLVAGALSNLLNGDITGGNGGDALGNGLQAGSGGAGVILDGGSASNFGRIAGGVGGTLAGGEGGYAGDGGIGLKAIGTGTTFGNFGTIIGGQGGLHSIGLVGEGEGGAGVADYGGAIGTNDGVIIGGSGARALLNFGADIYGHGNYGLIQRYSTFINNGTILGGGRGYTVIGRYEEYGFGSYGGGANL